MRSLAVITALSALALASVGCTQNWDLLAPEERAADPARSFTPIGGDRAQPLTGDEARSRLAAILEAEGEERLALVERFLADFREARLIPEVHRAAAEAHLAAGRPAEAADAFERALVVTRTDVLGLPLDTELPLQLAMSALAAGDTGRGLTWLARTTVADEGPRVRQSLAWAHAEVAPERPLEAWLEEIREPVLMPAPRFELPGFQVDSVAVPDSRSKATLINFWSPT